MTFSEYVQEYVQDLSEILTCKKIGHFDKNRFFD